MKKLAKLKAILLLWLVAYPLWLASAPLFYLFILLGFVRVHNWQAINFWPKRLIIVSNHPSQWEPVLLNYLFFPQTLILPFKFVPYSTPDLDNYNKWYWEIVKERFIFIPRKKPEIVKKAIIKIKEILRKGKIVIIFPEGGRTATNTTSSWLKSLKNHRLRPLKEGTAKLAMETDSPIMIVWVSGADKAMPVGNVWPKFWKRTDIYIGPTIKISGDYANNEDAKKGTEAIAQALLDLADSTNQVETEKELISI
ncbi:MAG: lysophospholipid acyltransferase family protein [Patescibacteria group bacterium]